MMGRRRGRASPETMTVRSERAGLIWLATFAIGLLLGLLVGFLLGRIVLVIEGKQPRLCLQHVL